MALCERCSIEILRGEDLLPEAWFDNRSHQIIVPGEPSRHCPRLQWKTLGILWHRRNGAPVSMETLVMLVYDGRDEPDNPENVVRTMIYHLRAALRGTAYTIHSVYGHGYRIADITGPVTYAQIGPIEPCDGPQPKKRFDKQYPFPWMRAGQSFLVRNSTLHTVRTSCNGASGRAYGRFVASQEATGVRVTMVSEIDLRQPTLTMRRNAARAPLRG
jgi:DNA-binding winged helix-turn-helix (wHTH) protein